MTAALHEKKTADHAERLGLLIVAVVYAGAAWLTWRRWPDLLVDFGAQLYLPWRLSQGDVLYRDVMYLAGGPVSQYFHAVLFRAFGASFLTLIVSNLVIGGGLLFLMYRKFLRVSDVVTATTICLGVILVLAFGQYDPSGNYNFVAPYNHEVWHGVVLSVVAVSLLSSWAICPRAASAIGAGLCAGLVFMTKPEVFLALVPAFALAFGLTMARGGLALAAPLLFWSIISAAVPLLGFSIYFLQFESWRTSLRSVAFAWVPLLTTSVAQGPFYQWCMGLDVPAAHLRRMLLQFAAVCGVVVFCGAWFRRQVDSPTRRLATVALIAAFVGWASRSDWVDSARSLPLLVSSLCLFLAAQLKTNAESEAGAVFPLFWGVFGLGLLAKLGLFPRIWHYGFILAMPAFAAAVYLFLWLLPQGLERYGVRRGPFRAAMWLLLMTVFLRLFAQSQQVLSYKTFAVGSGRDQVLTFSEGVQAAFQHSGIRSLEFT